MNEWKQINESVLVSDQWITLKAKTYELPSGALVSPYYVIEDKDWVHIVALDDGRVVTVTQYRPAGQTTCVELPAGIVEVGEAIECAAARELREETGLLAESMIRLASVWANPARQTNKVHVFLARGLKVDGPQRLDEAEAITCGRSSFSELMQLAATGVFGQLMHVGSLAVARAYLDTESALQNAPTPHGC